MQLVRPLSLILALCTAAPLAHAQLRSFSPAPPLSTAMPVPSTAAPAVAIPAGPPPPSSAPSVLPPQSPVTPARPAKPAHTSAPAPAVVPPPIVMTPPNMLSPSQLPPGVQPDSMAPTVPVPAGTPIGPPHP